MARSGELVHVVTGDVERLDGYVARYLPARAVAVTAPLLIVAVIAVIDPLTLPILLFAGPLLVILLALIGRTTAARTRRRERELAWLDGHFLDMIRGLPTLRLFGRSHEQADAIERVARQLAASSLDVLRTAFQTSLVLEWGATAATALVAIAVSVRLDGRRPHVRSGAGGAAADARVLRAGAPAGEPLPHGRGGQGRDRCDRQGDGGGGGRRRDGLRSGSRAGPGRARWPRGRPRHPRSASPGCAWPTRGPWTR